MVLDLQVYRYGFFLVERVLLRNRRQKPPTLQQLTGKKIILFTLNILEIIHDKSYLICYCFKFSGCAPHFCSDNFYACDVCQLFTDYCPYSVEKRIAKNIKYLIKCYRDITLRKNEIFKNIDESQVCFFNNEYGYKYLIGNIAQTFYLDYFIDPYELFV